MRVLHTSDWHIGRTLYGRQRYDEFEQFLQWLATTIDTEKIDVLLVAGDIFDTSTPSNRSQELYYRFLKRIAHNAHDAHDAHDAHTAHNAHNAHTAHNAHNAHTAHTAHDAHTCRHVIITGGNHDSPTFLNAPKTLLRGLNIHVVGSANLSDEVIVLRNAAGVPEGIVCAVPYLRDRDIRTVEDSESVESKAMKVVSGIKRHYHDVCRSAEQLRSELESLSGTVAIPIIGMGHLFAAGGRTTEGDGVRDLYISSQVVGGLAQISATDFPTSMDYLALGHLHAPQSVGGMEHIRYSGSPLPMGFGEAKQTKSIVVVEFGSSSSEPLIRELPIPCFQPLECITGSVEFICNRIGQLKESGSRAWLEVEYSGSDTIPPHSSVLQSVVLEALQGSAMELRRIKNRALMRAVHARTTNVEPPVLDSLSTYEVFAMRLDAHEALVGELLHKGHRDELLDMFDEIVRGLEEEDVNAE